MYITLNYNNKFDTILNNERPKIKKQINNIIPIDYQFN